MLFYQCERCQFRSPEVSQLCLTCGGKLTKNLIISDEMAPVGGWSQLVRKLLSTAERCLLSFRKSVANRFSSENG